MVNLEWYRTFKAIYQTGTLTKAAVELMISQPNVSIQLASLESYIGHPLFVRLPRKMMPTEYGKQLYTQIVESIDNLERVEVEFKKSTLSKIPDVKLGTPAEVFSSYMAANMNRTQTHLLVQYGLADDLSNKLINGELDIAVITQKSRPEDFITYEPLITESFLIVCNTATDTTEFDAYIAKNDLPKAEKWLLKQMWCGYNSNLPLIRRFWRENFNKRPLIKLRLAVPDNNAILDTICHGSFFAVSSDIIAGKSLARKEVKVLWRGVNPSTNVLYLAYNKSKIQPALIDEMRTFIKGCLEGF
ncbi:MAG: LysR family transcriptional regulator [Dysgonomonas sp.]